MSHSDPTPEKTSVTELQPLYCHDGPVLCRVHVWSDQRWQSTPAEERPRRAEYVQGLGWVVAFPVLTLN